MARTAVTVTAVDRTGTIALPALAAMDAVNNNNVANNGRVYLDVKNSGASTFTLTIPLPSTDLPDTQPGAALSFSNAGVQYSLTAGAEVLIGPFPPSVYNQTDGTVWLNPSNAALQVRAIQVN